MDDIKKVVWNPFSAAYLTNPYPHLEQCRETNPIQESVIGCWVFFRHDDIGKILKSDKYSVFELSSAFEKKRHRIFKGSSACPYLSKSTKNWPMHLNGTDHKPVRSIIGKAIKNIDFDDILVDSYESLLQYFDRQTDIDISHMCSYFQYLIVKRIFGLKAYGTYEKIKMFSNMLTKAQDSLSPKQKLLQTNDWLIWGKNLFGDSLFRDRVILYAGELEFDLTEEDLYSILLVSLAAAFETTKDTLAYAILKTFENNRRVNWVRSASESDMQLYAEEIIRLFSPAQYTVRVNHEVITIGEAHIPAGSKLMLCLASANRDPRIFESPNDVIINRPNHHLAFGRGTHFCLGSQIARQELIFAIKPMVDYLIEKKWSQSAEIKMGKQIFMRTYNSIKNMG